MKRYHLPLFRRACFRVLAPGLITVCGVGIAVAQGPVLVDPGSKEEAPVIEEPEAATTEEAPAAEAPDIAEDETPVPAPTAQPTKPTDAKAQEMAARAKQEMLRKLEAAKRVSNRPATTVDEAAEIADDRLDAGTDERPAARDEPPGDEPIPEDPLPEDALPEDRLPADDAVPSEAEELPMPRASRSSRNLPDLTTRRPLRTSRDVARERDDVARDAELSRPGGSDGRRSVVVRSGEVPVDRGQRAWESLGIVLDGSYEDSIVVRRVEPGTPAAQIGLRAGDTIVSVNGREVATPEELLDELDRMRSVRDLDLGVARRSSRTLRLSDRTASARVRVDPEVDQTAYESYFRGLPPADSEAAYADPRYAEPDAYLLRRPSYGELYREERYRAEPPPERRGVFPGRLLNRLRNR